MSDFITDVERQYELYCKIAEEHGFIDLNAKKSGFRCTTKSNEFNAGWIAFVGAVAAVRDDLRAEIDQLKGLLEKDKYAHNLYYENANLQTLVEEKDKRIEAALFQMRQQALSLKEDCDGYKDPVGICQSEGVDWCVRFLEKALQGFQGDRS